MSDRRPRIVIIGGGFAGISAAAALPSRKFAVTLFAPRPDFEWTPNIHELISDRKQARQLKTGLRQALAAHGHRFVQGQASTINGHEVVLDNGSRHPFSAAIVACGGARSGTNVPGAIQHAYYLRSIADGQRIARRLQQAWKHDHRTDVSIVGAGLSGVEVLGELLSRYGEDDQFRFRLVGSSARILPDCPHQLDAIVKHHAAGMGVDIHLGQRVNRVSARDIELANGQRIPSDITIWTAGQTPPELLSRNALAGSPDAWADVNCHLQSRRHDNLFVTGDAAAFPKPLDKQAFHAIDMGRLAAKNLRRYFAGQPLRDFRPSNTPRLISFGDIDTFLTSRQVAIANPWLNHGKELVYAAGMLRAAPPFSLLGLQQASKLAGSAWQRLPVGLKAGRRPWSLVSDTRLIWA